MGGMRGRGWLGELSMVEYVEDVTVPWLIFSRKNEVSLNKQDRHSSGSPLLATLALERLTAYTSLLEFVDPNTGRSP